MHYSKRPWAAALVAWMGLILAVAAPSIHSSQATERAGSMGLRFGLVLMGLLDRDWQLRGMAEGILVSCLEKARLTPKDGAFWSQGDVVANPHLIHMAFHSSDRGNLCNRVLTKVLKDDPVAVASLNSAVRAIQTLYGPAKGNIQADPIFQQIRVDYQAALREADLIRHWNARNLQRMQARLIDTAGRQMTRDETLVMIGMARRSFKAGSTATGMSGSSALLSLPELKKSGDIRDSDTAKANELVAALWDAKKPSGVKLQSPLEVTLPGTSEKVSLSRAMAQPGRFAAPVDRLREASPLLERASLEWAAKTIPKTAGTGSPAEEQAKVVTEVASRMNWAKGSNSDKWLELTSKTAGEALKKMLRSQASAMAQVPGRPRPDLAALETNLDQGVSELLGLSDGKRSIRASVSFSFKFAPKSSGTFADCVRVAGDGVQAIPNRVTCYQSAMERLKEPLIEWVARNLPVLGNGMKPLAEAWAKAAADVYGDPGARKALSGSAALRVQKLVYRGTTETLKNYYLDLAERMNHDFAADSLPGPVRPPLAAEKRKELGDLVETATREMWGRKGEDSAAVDLAAQPGGAPLSAEKCFEAAGMDIAKLKDCGVALYAKAGDRLNPWLLRNFPQGGPKMAFLTLAAKATHDQLYDEQGMPREAGKSGPDLMKEVPGRILSASADLAKTGLKSHLNEKQNLVQNEQQEVRRTDADALQANIDQASRGASRATVEATVPGAANPKAGTVEIGIGLASGTADGRLGVEKLSTTLVDAVESDHQVQRSVAALYGSMVLGVDAAEGKQEFMAAWDRIADHQVEKPNGFYEKLAVPLYQAVQEIKPAPGESIGKYVQRLNHEELEKKAGDIVQPLIDEMQVQVSCINKKTSMDRGPGSPVCGCYTRGGYVRTDKGNLFSGEISIMVSLLRAASMYNLPSDERVPSKGKSCRAAVGDFLDSIPLLAKSNPNSDFLAHPMAAIADAIEQDNDRSPSLLSCIVVGYVKKKVEPILKKASSIKLTGIAELTDGMMNGDNLIGLLNGKGVNPNTGQPWAAADPALTGRFKELSGKLALLFRNPGRSDTESFSKLLHNSIADGARDLTMLAATSPLITAPLLKVLKSDKSKLRSAVAMADKSRGSSVGPTMTDAEVNQLVVDHPQAMSELGATMIAPVAAWAAGVTKAALKVPDSPSKLSKAELNQCEDQACPVKVIPTIKDYREASKVMEFRCKSWSSRDASEAAVGASALSYTIGSLKNVFKFENLKDPFGAGTYAVMDGAAELMAQTTSPQRVYMMTRLIDAEKGLDRIGTQPKELAPPEVVASH